MQAIESAALSLAEFKKKARFPSEEIPGRRRRRDVEDALPIVFWARSLSAECGCRGARALENHFADDRAAPSKKRVYTLVWRGYLWGWNEPETLHEVAEKKYPGSSTCLGSPLWPALAASPLTWPQLNALVRRLDPDVCDLVSRRDLRPQLIDKNLVAMLERRAGLDALAAEILLLRRAHSSGYEEVAYRWGEYLWRMMLLVGATLIKGGIARPLAELLEERIMPMASLQGVRFGFPAGSYIDLAHAFNFMATGVCDQRSAGKPSRTSLSAAREVLDPRYGFDCRYAFNPIQLVDDRVPLSDLSQPALGEAQDAQQNLWLHTWGLNMLSRSRHLMPPPDAVYAGEDLWAVSSLELARRSRRELEWRG